MQKPFLGLGKYHVFVLLGYLLFVVALLFLAPHTFIYTVSLSDFLFFIEVVLALLFVALCINVWRQPVTLKRKTPIQQIVLLAALFAVPEELLFRGIIQPILTHSTHSYYWVILLSSLIFGLAHLPNGATSIHPQKWNWLFAIAAFIGGIPLALLYAHTGSLFFPTILHFLFLYISQQLSLKESLAKM